MNLFKRMKLDSVVAKESPVNKTKTKKKVKIARTVKTKKAKKFTKPVDFNREVAQENCFWVLDGPNLRSLADLCQALPQMTDDQFHHHTKRDGNDFAKWIAEVLQEEELAKKIARLKTRKSIVSAIKKAA